MYSAKTGIKPISFVKRTLLLFTAFMLVLSFIGSDMFTMKANAASKWDGWVKISSVNDLQLMNDSNKKFYLTKDIDLKGIEDWKPIGIVVLTVFPALLTAIVLQLKTSKAQKEDFLIRWMTLL